MQRALCIGVRFAFPNFGDCCVWIDSLWPPTHARFARPDVQLFEEFSSMTLMLLRDNQIAGNLFPSY